MPLKVVAPMTLPLVRKVGSDCLVDVDTNRYSVPHEYVGRKVEVLVAAGEVAIRYDGVEITPCPTTGAAPCDRQARALPRPVASP